MAANPENASMALFCDFENIALGVRDAQYEKFDIRPVLERLLAKGSIVVKKAYCDWDRYKTFKSAMHEANFELIEIPHVRQSGKNSADIRMVVDALDLCYTKAHVDTFVIISGDSDFSPLVSKLRENAKKVIGVGVKQSCSDLLVTNCDEFIYYDDLVREREAVRVAQRREREKRSPEEEAKRREKLEERKDKAIEIVSATFADLIADRGESERIWASVLKEVVRRRHPGFNENYYGFRSFGNLLEDAAGRGLLGFGRDDKGAYVFRAPVKNGNGEAEAVVTVNEPAVENEAQAAGEVMAEQQAMPEQSVASDSAEKPKGRRRSRGRRETAAPANGVEEMPTSEMVSPADPVVEVAASAVPESSAVAEIAVEPSANETPAPKAKRQRAPSRARKAKSEAPVTEANGEAAAPAPAVVEIAVDQVEVPKKPARRTSRPRKSKPATEAK